MKILVVGGGGREHAIVKRISENPSVEKIFALPGNGGIAGFAECVPIPATDIERIVDFSVEKKIDFAVIADRKSTRLNSVTSVSRMPSSA